MSEALKVLLIEDNKDDEGLIKRAIKSGGYEPIIHRVETEAATRVALEVRLNKWDLIICDYLLPGFSAVKALEMARETLGDIPFIILSGFEDEDAALRILKLGAHDFVYKSQIGRIPIAIRRELRHAGERMSSRLEIEKSYILTVEAWGIALERRDIYTKDHTIRVTDLTLRFARSLGVSSSQFKAIQFGALLHDIGKMGIPDSVLLKRDELDSEEREVMKKHPRIAFEMLSHIEFLREAVNIPYCHHEKWDGSGYPRGLHGEDIPFEARIFSVSDVYDALTNERPYRPPWPKDRAIAHLRSEKGKSFEPELVEPFIELIK